MKEGKDKIEHKSIKGKILGCERKAEGDAKGRLLVKFYGATFGNVDSYRDTIKKGAFAAGTDKENWDRVAFCKQHNMRQAPVGKIVELKENAKGLYCEVIISASEEDIATKIEEGILNEFSIGYITKSASYNDNASEKEAYRTLESIKLYEISVVTRAADLNATVISAERKEELAKEFDKQLSEKTDSEIQELKAKLDTELNNRLLLKINL